MSAHPTKTRSDKENTQPALTTAPDTDDSFMELMKPPTSECMDFSLVENGPPVQLYRSVALRVYGIVYLFGSPKESMTKILTDLGEIEITSEGNPSTSIDVTALRIFPGCDGYRLPRGPAVLRLPDRWWLKAEADEEWLDAVKWHLEATGMECSWNGAMIEDRSTVLDFEWKKRIFGKSEVVDISFPTVDEVKRTMRAVFTQAFPNRFFTGHVFRVKIDERTKMVRGSTRIQLPSTAQSIVSKEYDLSIYNGIKQRGYILRFSKPSGYISPNYCCDLAINCRRPLSQVQAEYVLLKFAARFNRDHPTRYGWFDDYRWEMKGSWLVVSPSNPWIAFALTKERMPNGLDWQYLYELNAAPRNYNKKAAIAHALMMDENPLENASIATARYMDAPATK